MEEMGRMFKGDPTFDFIFNRLPSGHFMKIVELRKKRLEESPAIDDLL